MFQGKKGKGGKPKSADCECIPMGQGMQEMMAACCAGRDGSPDCSTMMKRMMETMKNPPCCTPKKEAAEPEGRKQ